MVFTAESISSIILMISSIVLVAGNFAAGGLYPFYGFTHSTCLGDVDCFWCGIDIYICRRSIFICIYRYFSSLFNRRSFWAAFLYFAFGFSGVHLGAILTSAPTGYLDFSGLTDMKNGALTNWASILSLGLGDIVALDFMERVFSAKSGKTARNGALMTAGLTISIIIPVSMMGIIGLHFLPNATDPYTVYPTIAIHYLPFPIGAALLMGVIGASMSTANGGLLAISSVIVRNLIQRDFLRTILKRTGLSDKKLLLTTRMVTIPIMLTGLY